MVKSSSHGVILTYPSYLIGQFRVANTSIEIYQLLFPVSNRTISVCTFSIYIQSG